MFSFECDYHEGAHQAVLLKLIQTNMEQLPGYGTDHYSEEAKEKIKEACGCPNGQVFFFAGGTQTNVTVIDSILRSYDGIIAADTGHVNVHEAGGVEFTGHKVLTLPNRDGKIAPQDLKEMLVDYYEDEAWDHMVCPGGVYVSHPTELGTLYSKAELVAIRDVCHEYGIPLYLDGARLGYGLASDATDLTLKDIAEICDVFYIGGTKVGALCGEAVVFPKGDAPLNFFTIMKQRGAVFAKGRVTAVQFDALFSDDLYFQLGEQALAMAELMKTVFRQRGYQFYVDSPTNMQFIVVDKEKADKLAEHVGFEKTGKVDEDNLILRFCTSWATTPEDIQHLADILDEVDGRVAVTEEVPAEAAAVAAVAAEPEVEDVILEQPVEEAPVVEETPEPVEEKVYFLDAASGIVSTVDGPLRPVVEPIVDEVAEEATEEAVEDVAEAAEEPEIVADEEPAASEEPVSEEVSEEAPEEVVEEVPVAPVQEEVTVVAVEAESMRTMTVDATAETAEEAQNEPESGEEETTEEVEESKPFEAIPAFEPMSPFEAAKAFEPDPSPERPEAVEAAPAFELPKADAAPAEPIFELPKDMAPSTPFSSVEPFAEEVVEETVAETLPSGEPIVQWPPRTEN